MIRVGGKLETEDSTKILVPFKIRCTNQSTNRLDKKQL